VPERVGDSPAPAGRFGLRRLEAPTAVGIEDECDFLSRVRPDGSVELPEPLRVLWGIPRSGTAILRVEDGRIIIEPLMPDKPEPEVPERER